MAAVHNHDFELVKQPPYSIEVFRRARVDKKLLQNVRFRQMRFLGHVMHKEGLENLALAGKIEGKRSRGRRRVSWISSLRYWLEENGFHHQEEELWKKANNRTL